MEVVFDCVGFSPSLCKTLSERAINTAPLPVQPCKEEAASPAGKEAASVLGVLAAACDGDRGEGDRIVQQPPSS